MIVSTQVIENPKMWWLQLLFCVLLVTQSYAQDSKAEVKILSQVRKCLENSTMVKQGLYGALPLQKPDTGFTSLKLASEDQINEFQKVAEENFQSTEEENINFFIKQIDKSNNDTPIFGPHLLTDPTSIEISKPGNIIGDTTKETVRQARSSDRAKSLLNPVERFEIFDLINRLHIFHPPNICPFVRSISCDFLSLYYRKIDGSCNNLNNPYWGKSATPFERFLIPEYDGPTGTNEPRTTAQSGNPLPGAREVSVLVHTPSDASGLVPPLSYYIMQYGQFLDHDITKTALSKGYWNSNLDCCQFPSRRDCFPIPISPTDPYFDGHTDCLNFVRSIATPALDCSREYRQQLNELTHYIDASNVYGSTAAELNQLRDGTTGYLKMSAGNRLPLDVSNEAECIITGMDYCFKAGDKRANVQPGLSAIHTIWAREHNRIAKYLDDNNPAWSDETVFQQARRFVIAEMQHITYKEFLPKVLHHIFMTHFDLKPKASGFFTGYDNTIKPMIRNGFATAAYRFGHSLLRDHFFFNNIGHQLHNHFNNPNLHYQPQGLEGCTRGLYTHATQKYDEKLTTEVTNKLFETAPFNGGDLAAFNIQRGRDHGLPSYGKWVEHCFGADLAPHSFDAGVLGGLFFHSAAAAAKLESVYEAAEDIDLFAGAMSENNLPDMRLGPTFSCILSLQFKALKYGDRFYYEGNAAYPFTSAQLDNIRQTTMARVICENSAISNIPRDVFLEENPTLNPLTSCGSLPKLDLPCTPVNGGWSSWRSVTICRQVRYCNNPKPTACGQDCVGPSVRFICVIRDESIEIAKTS